MALCPTPTCTATTHLLCLSRHFLKEEDTSLIPRGGVCVCCKSYVLWGEVIKGCYRRTDGVADMTNKRDEDDDEKMLGFTSELDLESEAGAEVLHVSPPKCGRPRKAMGGPAKPKQTKGTKRKSKLLAHPTYVNVSDEGEFFDLNAISSDDEGDGVRPAPCAPHMPSRVPNITATATKIRRSHPCIL
jgi:structure-specific endonuclease subunit SLX1